jgi:hypothetical protein
LSDGFAHSRRTSNLEIVLDLIAHRLVGTSGRGGVGQSGIGVLGLVAEGRRDGFHEATVIAVTIFGVGATIVHIMDITATRNLAPGTRCRTS